MYGMVGGKKSLRDVYTLKVMNSNHVIPNLPADLLCLVPKIERIPWGTRLEHHPHYLLFNISSV